MSNIGLRLFQQMKGIDPEVSRDDYFDEEQHAWDVEGLEEDLKVAQDRLQQTGSTSIHNNTQTSQTSQTQPQPQTQTQQPFLPSLNNINNNNNSNTNYIQTLPAINNIPSTSASTSHAISTPSNHIIVHNTMHANNNTQIISNTNQNNNNNNSNHTLSISANMNIHATNNITNPIHNHNHNQLQNTSTNGMNNNNPAPKTINIMADEDIDLHANNMTITSSQSTDNTNPSQMPSPNASPSIDFSDTDDNTQDNTQPQSQSIPTNTHNMNINDHNNNENNNENNNNNTQAQSQPHNSRKRKNENNDMLLPAVKKQRVEKNKWNEVALKKLFSLKRKVKNSGWFWEPVDEIKHAAPNYYLVCPLPADYGTICTKLEKRQYNTLDEFLRDCELVFINARLYNTSVHAVHIASMELEKKFKDLMNTFVEQHSTQYGSDKTLMYWQNAKKNYKPFAVPIDAN